MSSPALSDGGAGDAPRSGDASSVFISYSRKDSIAAERLRQGLIASGFSAQLDTHDILPGEAWQNRLTGLIGGADSVVFLISPDSVSSSVCDWEVNEAERLGKRLLPVVIRDPVSGSVPRRLERLNYIFMRSAAEESAGLGALRAALLTDIEWIREHTRLGELAAEWESHARPSERLLRGSALEAAGLWLTSRPREAPEPTELQRAYIEQSRLAEQADLARERSMLRATRRRLGEAVVLMALLAAGLVAWINKDYLQQLYYWHTVMKPTVLTAQQEKALVASPGKDFKECEVNCPAMIVIPAGEFMMGEDPAPGDTSELAKHTQPRHKVTIPHAFAVSKTEVTFAQWDACTEATQASVCPKAGDAGMGRGDKPVIEVAWEEARLYADWLSRRTGKTYRLLTEAEWEYAARGITDADQPHPMYPWGDEVGTNNANCKLCGSPFDGQSTSPVGSFKPNAFGLQDMVGNVWEWVEDHWHETYDGAPADGRAWTEGGDPELSVVRGGSWLDYPESSGSSVGSSRRSRDRGYVRQWNFGFRLARIMTPD